MTKGDVKAGLWKFLFINDIRAVHLSPGAPFWPSEKMLNPGVRVVEAAWNRGICTLAIINGLRLGVEKSV